MSELLLEVKDLRSYYFLPAFTVKAIDGVSFGVAKAEALGIIGESGSGKSTIGWSVLRALPNPGKIVSGQIRLDGKNLLELDREEMRKIRWKEIAMITQSAMSAFDPLMRIGDQITEAVAVHENLSQKAAVERAKAIFQEVSLEPSRFSSYPHEMSGGMRQRAMIAMALVCKPKLVIADEPTTALDVIVQAQILRLLGSLKRSLGSLSVLFISHDLSVVAGICDKILVVYGGKMIEYGTTNEILKNPLHPYTIDLVNSFPNIEETEMSFESIPGSPPDMRSPPSGCVFHPRCKYAWEKCQSVIPNWKEIGDHHFVACHLHDEGGAWEHGRPHSKS
ncbi:MAG: ABC transporter ATP-binding protein [Candidatus Bathyarchaeia archaeon]|jgi:oligopeptide/dipeptide ABC transporter ATP-binding protein